MSFLRVHFLHISKTGGTAIKQALASFTSDGTMILHPHSTKLRDVALGQKVCFFARSPVDRFVSGFLSRQRQGQPRYFHPWTEQEKEAFQAFPRVNDLAEALSVGGSLGKKAIDAMGAIRHLARPLSLWLESEQYLLARREDIFFVGLQENLQHDFERLKVLLGLPLTVKLPEDDLSAHRAPPTADRDLSKNGRENILRWYARDIELYETCERISSSFHDPSH